MASQGWLDDMLLEAPALLGLRTFVGLRAAETWGVRRCEIHFRRLSDAWKGYRSSYLD